MMWNLRADQQQFEALQPLARCAKRERLSFKPTQNTTWFGLFAEDELIGCGGMIWGDKNRTWARLKAALILPEWRHRGGYRILVEARVAYASAHGAAYCQTITRNAPMFEHWGWHQVGPRKSLYQLDLT